VSAKGRCGGNGGGGATATDVCGGDETFKALILFFLLIISILTSFLSKTLLQLPPGPPGLPIIGNLHQLDMSDLSDYLWRLSKRYGPLMSIRLGMVQTLVVSSAEIAKEVMKTNDLNFCTRPVVIGLEKISYANKDLAFLPYSEVAFGKRSAAYADERKEVIWLQKNLLECQALLGQFYFKDMFSFMGWLDKLNGSIARLEKNVKDMDEFYQQLIDEHLNPDRPNIMQEDMVDILLKLKHDPDSSVSLTFYHIKAVLMNILLRGTDTYAASMVWAMMLLIKNSASLKKLQQEVRDVIGNKGKPFLGFVESGLLIPREAIDRCVINGYEIPKKTLVYVNAWAARRDPNCWERPEDFEPERFMGGGSSIDYKGIDFELIPYLS
ncbi:cytochrome P450, partial [Tanacetum coccineum]